MTDNLAFFILIPAMYALFAISLAVMAYVDRRLISARWAALSSLVAFASIIIDMLRDPSIIGWQSWVTVSLHFLAVLILMQALVARHGKRVPQAAMAIALIGSILIIPETPWQGPNWSRAVLVQGIGFLIVAASLPVLWKQWKTSLVDRFAFIVSLGFGLSYLGRMIAAALNPVGDTRADVAEFYQGLALVFHSTSALMGMLIGLVMMLSIGYDMLMGRIEQSEIDPLTKLGNRRRLDRIIASHETGERTIGAVLVIDLDHFKKINDLFGHDAGDEVLRRVSARLQSMLRPFGEICRTGGEEFVALVDECYAPGISALCLSVRAAIAKIEFDAPLNRATITASVGFHLRTPDVSVHDAIHKADQAVYYAKSNGRNQVVAALNERGLDVLKAVA